MARTSEGMLRALLQFCHPKPGCTGDEARWAAYDAAMEFADHLAMQTGRLPDARKIITELVAEGYCDDETLK